MMSKNFSEDFYIRNGNDVYENVNEARLKVALDPHE